MFFGISDADLLDKNKIKIISGIAGSGKSQSAVDNLRRLGVNFCLASFSNALKFAAADRFKCDTDTICGLAFENYPHPRYAEKDVTEYDAVILDEILLDGIDCLKWIKSHATGKVNIIALTDDRQMLQAENGKAVIKAFDKLCKQKNVIYVETTKTYRAKNDETRAMYDELYNLNSDQLFTISQAMNLFKCDLVKFDDISYNRNNTYICHSNRIEHEVYKRYGLCNRYDIDLIPKNHIARDRNVDVSKYPICDQITATDKKLTAYVQAANCATPTRFQGREVEVGDDLYFIVEKDSLFTGRELYTVGTRAKDIKSIHIAMVEVSDYRDPVDIKGIKVVEASRLNIPDYSENYMQTNSISMWKFLKEHGDKSVYYYDDYVMSDNKVVLSTISTSKLNGMGATVTNEKGVFTIEFNKSRPGARKSIKSITKKDPSMHFDFMPKVYSIINDAVKIPRINNPKGCNKNQFQRLCDLRSAFPTILNFADMPSAGFIYEQYDKDLLNFYIYEGDVVTNGSLITEELADKLGNSRYVFSTSKQVGCELGRYTYTQSKISKEKKAKINHDFKWGILYRSYYDKKVVCKDGVRSQKYVKCKENNLELVACALWSKLCLIMIEAIESMGEKKFVVVTDGIYYTSDKMPKLPEWCDYRIDDLILNRALGKDGEKYGHIIYKTYDDLKTNNQIKNQKERAKRTEAQRLRRAKQKEELKKLREAQ